MLKLLKINNFALIDNLEVDFSDGMTCITGETGAGKSIILGALTLVLGKRADLSSFFDRDRKCIVEATFEISSYGLKSLFESHHLDYEEETIIRREILAHGKSRAFINDSLVKLSVLETISLSLIDIHSQDDSRSLLQNDYQFQVLDALANNQKKLADYQKALVDYKFILNEYQHLKKVQLESKDDFNLKQFLFEELKSSNLEVGVEEDIKMELDTLSHVEYLQSSFATSIQLLELESYGIIDQLKELRRNSHGFSSKSDQYEQINKIIQNITLEAEDVLEIIKKKFEHLEANPKKLFELQTQMDHLNTLYQKHKVKTIDELIDIKEKLGSALNETISIDDKLVNLSKKEKQQKKILTKLSQNLSQKRHQVISLLEEELKQLVSKMGMKDALFKINLSRCNEFLHNGVDRLSFQFSPNKGGDFKLLKKVVSVGELSRIMLAIKTVLSRYKKLPTLIFDEIDTGVSGKISDNIAEVMSNMSKELQVLTITHLPQVAAKGDHHFKVEKRVESGKTMTHLYVLSYESRVNEIANMLSGNKVTETAIAHARQLIN